MIIQFFRRIYNNLIWILLYVIWICNGFMEEVTPITPINMILLCVILYCDPWIIEVFYAVIKIILRPVFGLIRNFRGRQLPQVTTTVFLYLIFVCLVVIFVITAIFCKEFATKLKEISYNLFAIKELVIKASMKFEAKHAIYADTPEDDTDE